eukprot:gene13188-27895_t
MNFFLILIPILNFSLTVVTVRGHTSLVEPVLMPLGHEYVERINTKQAKTFCYDNEDGYFPIVDIFSEVRFSVMSTEPTDLSFHDVRGLSSDDFHSHIEWAVFKILSVNKKHSNSEVGHDLEKFEGFIRDIFSACPTPFSFNKQKCIMKFSPYGRSCITINPANLISVSIEATVGRTCCPRNFDSKAVAHYIFSGIVVFSLKFKRNFFQDVSMLCGSWLNYTTFVRRM